MLTRLLNLLFTHHDDDAGYAYLPQRLRARHSALLRYSRHH